LAVDSLREIKSAALTIIRALHKQSLAHGFTLLKIEGSESGIFLEPTNNLEPIQVAIDNILDRKILRNIELLEYIGEVSKFIGQKVLSLTIFSNGSRDLISNEYLNLQCNMEVFFLGPSSCNMSALQAQANKFTSGDASYCLDFMERVSLIEQMQQSEISNEDVRDKENNSPKKQVDSTPSIEPAKQLPTIASSINFDAPTKRLEVVRRAANN